VTRTALLAALLLCAACGQRVEQPPDAPLRPDAATLAAQHLRRQIPQAPRTLDPALNVDISSQRIIDDLFEGLTRVDAAGEVVPALAERWEQSADGLRWTFHLRRNARWSNGDPVTAHDVVFGWRRVVDPATASLSAQQLAPVVNALDIVGGRAPPDRLGIRALDDWTLEVRLVAPTSYFPYLLTNHYYFPLHAATLERHGRAWTRPENLVGNGAFLLESLRINGAIVLRRNDAYWDASSVRLARVTYFPLPDYSSATARYLAGDLDLTDGFLIDDIQRLRARLGEEVRLAPYLGTVMLAMHVGRPPFDSAALREAMTLAIDREIITDKLLRGLYLPANSMVPPLDGYPGVPPAWTALGPAERLARARRLYAEAGYSSERPLRVELAFPTMAPDTRRVLEALTAMWRTNLGADVQLANQEWRVHQQNRRMGQFALYWFAWIGDYPDPSTFLALLQKGNGQNVGGYADARYEALMSEAASSADTPRRMQLFATGEALLNEAAVVLPIYYYQSRHLLRPYVGGWRDNVMDRHLSRDLYLRAADTR
jgi:oligopeptide transport system substrate-binding protein